ncbi:MAG: PD-(D/E)XK nuclease family protein [Woeseiaceae bacterium]
MNALVSDGLIDRVASGEFGLVVTSNQRLSRKIQQALSERMLATGIKAWASPEIIPWNAWMNRTFRAGCVSAEDDRLASTQLLGKAQSDALWRDIVEEKIRDKTRPFYNIGSLAAEVGKAFSLLQRWQLTDEYLFSAVDDEDSRFLADCIREYRRAQLSSHWIIEDELAALLSATMTPNEFCPDRRVLLTGFTQLYPIQERIVQLLGDKAEIFDADYGAVASDIQVRSWPSDDDCLRAAGRWARQQRNERPTGRIAIVVPGMGSDVEAVRRLVLDGYCPGYQYLLPDQKAHLGVAVSLGQPISEFPAAGVLITFLRFTASGARFDALSRLLRTPLFRNDSHAVEIELALRRIPDRLWTPKLLIGWMNYEDKVVPSWLAAADELQRSGVAQKSASAWAEAIQDALARAGWLAGLAIDSELFQLRDAIFKTLNTLSEFDYLSRQWTLGAAVDSLSRIMDRQLFQVEDLLDDVLVLGPLEAIGLQFDGVWIVGLDNQSWPPTPQPSNLIPRALQRRHGMPDSSPAQVLDFWQGQFSRLLKSADLVVLSYANSRDEAELGPAPMLRAVVTEIESFPTEQHSLLATLAMMEATPQQAALPTLPSRSRSIGGHGVLSEQLVDPFGAVIRYRWQCTPLDEPVIGINAAMRGKLLHAALETLYGNIADSAELSTWTPEGLQGYVVEAVAATFRSAYPSADNLLVELLRVEERRAVELVQRVLAQDLQRPAFSVAALEKQCELRLGELTIRLRLDRVDEVDGQSVIIDYKTGRLGAMSAFDQLPSRQMQLVAYALALDSTAIGGVVLVSVNFDKVSALTWLDSDNAKWDEHAKIKKVDDYPVALAAWSELAHQLAHDFCRGDVRLNRAIPVKDRIKLLGITRINDEHLLA